MCNSERIHNRNGGHVSFQKHVTAEWNQSSLHKWSALMMHSISHLSNNPLPCINAQTNRGKHPRLQTIIVTLHWLDSMKKQLMVLEHTVILLVFDNGHIQWELRVMGNVRWMICLSDYLYTQYYLYLSTSLTASNLQDNCFSQSHVYFWEVLIISSTSYPCTYIWICTELR